MFLICTYVKTEVEREVMKTSSNNMLYSRATVVHTYIHPMECFTVQAVWKVTVPESATHVHTCACH